MAGGTRSRRRLRQVTAATCHNVTDNLAAGSFAAEQRVPQGASRSGSPRLTRYLSDNVFWSALENAPRTALAGYLAKKRGVRSGLADLMVPSGTTALAGAASELCQQGPAGCRSAAGERRANRSALKLDFRTGPFLLTSESEALGW